jgi:hypothetical protein
MVSSAVTRSVYLESATFQDEIDTHQMDAWRIKGTQKLFVGEKSHVDLVDGSPQVSHTKVNFRFKEYMQFRIPFRPTVYLTGQKWCWNVISRLVWFHRIKKYGIKTFKRSWRMPSSISKNNNIANIIYSILMERADVMWWRKRP